MKWSTLPAATALAVAVSVVALAGDGPGGDAAADSARGHSDAPLAAGPGDVVSVSVLGHPELSQRVRVGLDGSVVYPFVGAVQVTGRTHDEVSRRIEAALRDEYQMRAPRVFVALDTVAATVIYVAGEVGTTGAHAIEGPHGVSLLQALAVAGGPREDADLHHVCLHRAGESGPGVLIDISDGSATAASVRLGHGDTVFVPRARRISVLGDVPGPGTFPHDAGAPLTLVRAIAHAGGFLRSADRERVVWISGAGDSRVVRHVDASRILAGADDDPVLAPGDLVVVESRTL